MKRFRLLLPAALLAFVVAGFGACDSGVMNQEQPGDIASKGDKPDKKELICHVGSLAPNYDPTCTENCGDAGKIDLIEVVAGTHQLACDPAAPADNCHCFDGTCDYYPADIGADPTLGSEDTSDDGVFVDDGCAAPAVELQCVIPDWADLLDFARACANGFDVTSTQCALGAGAHMSAGYGEYNNDGVIMVYPGTQTADGIKPRVQISWFAAPECSYFSTNDADVPFTTWEGMAMCAQELDAALGANACQ